MIVVTGTKRAGTSMWMQILGAAGFPVWGEAFPCDWGRTIRDANKEGFYESSFRSGIYHATNPNPRTGCYLAPEATSRLVVKVFVPGLVKSDVAFLGRVLATMRAWREYDASITRLYAMERDNKRALAVERGEDPARVWQVERMPPVLEWWLDNFLLVRDALTRRYPLHMVSYARVLENPERAVRETLNWLGGGDAYAAVSRVRDSLRTQRAETPAAETRRLAPEVVETFDEFYARVDERRPFDAAFITRLNTTHERLQPAIRAAIGRIRRNRQGLRTARAAASAEPETGD